MQVMLEILAPIEVVIRWRMHDIGLFGPVEIACEFLAQSTAVWHIEASSIGEKRPIMSV